MAKIDHLAGFRTSAKLLRRFGRRPVTGARSRYRLALLAGFTLTATFHNSGWAQSANCGIDGHCPPGQHCVAPGPDKPGHCVKNAPPPPPPPPPVTSLFVDWQYSGLEDGTSAHPIQTISAALIIAATQSNINTIVIRTGSYSIPARSLATPITLRADNGPVTMTGQPLESATTYHYDNYRTGWNRGEITLTSGVLRSWGFGPLHTVAVDEKISAQPLVVPNQPINTLGGVQGGRMCIGDGQCPPGQKCVLTNGPGKPVGHCVKNPTGVKIIRDVVYVVTEANTVYAIDAISGDYINSRTIAPAAPYDVFNCGDNGPSQGITSTPVIDTATNTMYLISVVYPNLPDAVPAHQLHAIDLTTLDDKVPPVTISVSHPLAVNDDTPYTFNSKVTRQRAGLIETNGNIYAGFASHCDYNADKSRGWLLGWNSTNLAPLPANYLTNRLFGLPSYYLTSIWMSGFGIASDGGSLYVVTGNSAPQTNSAFNLSEAAVAVDPESLTPTGSFTPQNVEGLEQSDLDFGSGGITLLPDQRAAFPRLAVAAGKNGKMFLLNRDNMNALATYDIGSCFCGASYFEGSDGVARIVSSGGSPDPGEPGIVPAPAKLIVWKLGNDGGRPFLAQESSTQVENGGRGGFFTSVSSNRSDPSSVVIWAVTRPADKSNPLVLYAFDAKGNQLFKKEAGQWNVNGQVYSMPVVTNGRAYVASNKLLTIFGLGTTFQKVSPMIVAEGTRGNIADAVGVVTSVDGSVISVRKRDGKLVKVDISKASASHMTVPIAIGKEVAVYGAPNAEGILEAASVSHGESQ